jgi:hypothetical protein
MSNKKIAESIFRKLGKEGMAHVEETGELPAVKLTSEEMNLLKAGMGPYKNVKDVLGELKSTLDPKKIEEMFKNGNFNPNGV